MQRTINDTYTTLNLTRPQSGAVLKDTGDGRIRGKFLYSESDFTRTYSALSVATPRGQHHHSIKRFRNDPPVIKQMIS